MQDTTRSDPSAYSDMLSLQAKINFPFERQFFSLPQWIRAEHVLDFGCGNGAFARRLSDEFASKKLVGVEIDPDMRDYAKRIARDSMTVFANASEVPADMKFDFVLLRFVLQHIANRSEIYEFILAHASQRCAVLIIEADDQALSIDPIPLQYAQALTRTFAKSKDRSFRELLVQELANIGFRKAHSRDVVVNNRFPHVASEILRYMYRMAELGAGSPLPEPVKRDLIEWWMCYPYVQYGFYGELYERE